MTAVENDMAYWWPRVVDCGVPMPRTKVITLGNEDACNLSKWYYGVSDGEEPGNKEVASFNNLAAALETSARAIGDGPWFLRTGHTSGKHDFAHCCYVTSLVDMRRHILNLIEFSEMAGMIGLPYDTWAIREYLPVKPLFRAFGGTPIVREFRVFTRNGLPDRMQPYWPSDAITRPDRENWRDLLAKASIATHDDIVTIARHTRSVAARVPGHDWSIDFLDVGGVWYMTDMAIAGDSYVSDDVRLIRLEDE